MPSSKDPLSTVNPGPGKLPAGTVTASAILIPGGGGGGGGGALLAHITDPVDAHMASAIGVNPTDPTTGQTILSLLGGPVDGESVLDFIVQAKDLFPIRPDKMGFEALALPNSGIPSWDTLTGLSVRGGAWSLGLTSIFSHFILAAGTVTSVPTGVVYPADRGVLAVYRSTDGDYTNPGTTTLYAAVWLGSVGAQPVALTCPTSNFVDLLRTGLQANYIASGVGLDKISLTSRLPYLKDYTPYAGVYADFATDFFAYQLATFGITMPALVAGSNDSYLVIHWKESYAVSNAAIAPAALLANYVASKVYSHAPPGSFDAVPTDVEGNQAINRRYIYLDTLSATLPTLASWALTANGVPSTVFLSGVEHYDNVGGTLNWTTLLRVNSLVGNAWLPGTISSVDLPVNFVTGQDPVEYTFDDFGGLPYGRAYYDLRKATTFVNYALANAPQPADQVEHSLALLTIPTPVSFTPTSGLAKVKSNLNRPWSTAVVVQADSWVFNSWPQAVGSSSTSTFEPFRDERYRYKSSVVPLPVMLVEPVPADKFDSTIVLLAGTADAQVVGDQLVYPQIDYSPVTVHPVGPDYAAVLAGDAALHTRVFLRFFNTGVARALGRIRVRGIVLADFAANNPFTGSITGDHLGGVAMFVKIPGVTGLLDLGRPLGDPDLNTALDFRGCQTGVVVSGPDTIVSYNMTAFTANNGAGEFPLYFALALIKGPGTAKAVEEVEWLPP